MQGRQGGLPGRGDRFGIGRLSRIRANLAVVVSGAIALAWLAFYLVYPYRLLIDDSRYRSVLENRSFLFLGDFFRPIHGAILYFQGWIGSDSMERAYFVSICIHLGLCALAARLILLRDAPSRALQLAGLAAFAFHPVALQTVVHVAQRGEILGALFALASAGWIGASTDSRSGCARRAAWTAGMGLLALLSKENYVAVPLTVLALRMRTAEARAASAVGLAALLAASVVVMATHTFSSDRVRNDSNWRRSHAFHESVQRSQRISNEDSIILPTRSAKQNLLLQTALVPEILRISLFPFGLVKDYGHFPFGERTYSELPLRAALGGAFAILLLAVFWRASRSFESSEDQALAVGPLALYAVYFVVVVYDPLVLYRLYGFVFLLLVFTLPALAMRFGIETRRKMAIALACLGFAGGVARTHEMRDLAREAELEVARQPLNFRSRIELARSKHESGIPVDCVELHRRALDLSPSPALAEIEIAYCFFRRGLRAQAREWAARSLRSESVPENIDVAIHYLTADRPGSFELADLHPSNRDRVLGAKPSH